MKNILFSILFLAFLSEDIFPATVYVNSQAGNDNHSGSVHQPVKTLARAVALVNDSALNQPVTIIIAPGLYPIEETLQIGKRNHFSKDNRLTIRAELPPDSDEWRPESMPILTPVQYMAPDSGKTFAEMTGLLINVDHVTIQGLKFTGSPLIGIWYYPIFREGKDLKDLLVTQCFFVMDKHASASNVGILANGHQTVVEHCIFAGCRNPVVFWRAVGDKSFGNIMRHCIVDDAYTSAVWVCDTAEDFQFHNNIVRNCKYVWMRDKGNLTQYRLHDCHIFDFEYWSGHLDENGDFHETANEIGYTEKSITKQKNPCHLITGDGIDTGVPRNYYHSINTEGIIDLDAGLINRIKPGT